MMLKWKISTFQQKEQSKRLKVRGLEFKIENILDAFFLDVNAQLRILHNQSNILLCIKRFFLCAWPFLHVRENIYLFAI